MPSEIAPCRTNLTSTQCKKRRSLSKRYACPGVCNSYILLELLPASRFRQPSSWKSDVVTNRVNPVYDFSFKGWVRTATWKLSKCNLLKIDYPDVTMFPSALALINIFGWVSIAETSRPALNRETSAGRTLRDTRTWVLCQGSSDHVLIGIPLLVAKPWRN